MATKISLADRFNNGQAALKKWTEAWKDNDSILSELRAFIETVKDVTIELENCEPMSDEMALKVYELLILIERW